MEAEIKYNYSHYTDKIFTDLCTNTMGINSEYTEICNSTTDLSHSIVTLQGLYTNYSTIHKFQWTHKQHHTLSVNITQGHIYLCSKSEAKYLDNKCTQKHTHKATRHFLGLLRLARYPKTVLSNFFNNTDDPSEPNCLCQSTENNQIKAKNKKKLKYYTKDNAK